MDISRARIHSRVDARRHGDSLVQLGVSARHVAQAPTPAMPTPAMPTLVLHATTGFAASRASVRALVAHDRTPDSERRDQEAALPRKDY